MKKIILLIFVLFSQSLLAVGIWVQAVPTQIHIVPDGLVVRGLFNASGVTCSTDNNAVFLPNTDPNYNAKLTIALAAKATGQPLQVRLGTASDSECKGISAMGEVPVAYFYYWQML